MDESYVNGLSVLKWSFLGTSETPTLVEIIARAGFRHSPFTILDVGTGDGRSLVKIVESLEARGLNPLATGVDQFTPQIDAIRGIHAGARVVADFSNWECQQRFDVVLSRQSLYHFSDVEGAVRRMASFVSEDGILIIVAWSKKCALRQLALDIFGASEGVGLDSEQVASVVTSIGLDVTYKEFTGPIYPQAWLEEPGALESVLRVIARSNSQFRLTQGDIDIARDRLASLPGMLERSNGIIVARL